AIRTLRLAREAGGWNLVKLEVLGEAKTLYPDMRETLRATEVLVKEGFEPMVYCVDDPIAAKQLEEAGAVAIMPLGAPIGSGLGIQNRVTIRLIIEQAKVPVLVDAGVGTASDAAEAMELGCDAVLMNTAIAHAKDPILMARAMKAAIEAGRLSYLAGRMPKKLYADPSSPLGREPAGNAAEIRRAIAAVQSNRAAVTRVIVGHETIQNGTRTVDDLIQAMDEVRRGIGGSDIPVGTAENWGIWLREPRLAAAS